MDVSTLRGREAALTCEQCGYPRRGLSPNTYCPECGSRPARTAVVTSGLPPLTIGQQSQIRLVALGLGLLLYASFYSIQLAVVMEYQQLSLHAINLPSPKIAAVTLVQREIGGRPGPWGVMGWTCVLFQLIAVYLITVPSLRNAAVEGWMSLRRVCRWTALVMTAALMGFMLSHGHTHIPLLSGYTWDLLFYALTFGELPINLFLYLHLARLADSYRQPRLARSMRWIAWIGTAVRLACVVVMVLPLKDPQLRDNITSLVLSVMACFAIPAAVVAWAAVLTLMTRTFRLGYAKPVRRLAALARDRAPVMRRVMQMADQHGARCAVVAGLVLWMMAVAGQFTSAVAVYPGRQGLGGELPLLNYAGPKISADWLQETDRYWRFGADQRVDVGSLMLIVFLLTTRLPGQTTADDRMRRFVRWGILGVIGVRTGLLLTLSTEGVRDSYIRVIHVLLIEAPATMAMMVYLARVARLQLRPDLQRRLKQWSLAAVALIVVPLSLHVLSRQTLGWHQSWQIAAFGAIYCTASLAAGVIVLRHLASLTWTTARPLWATPVRSLDQDRRSSEPLLPRVQSDTVDRSSLLCSSGAG